MSENKHRRKSIKHLAIIMDGNGRWALNKGLKRSEGHEKGIKNCIKLLTDISRIELKITFITFYVFSTENWKRSSLEINNLFKLIEDYYAKFSNLASEKDFKIQHLGSLDKLPTKIKNIINNTVELTKLNNGIVVNLAFNYGSRKEIIDSMNSSKFSRISEKSLVRKFYIKDLPDPDLIIRTGGEIRLSNFLLWQAAYSELYFVKTLWPNFKLIHLKKILHNFLNRNRRFGK